MRRPGAVAGQIAGALRRSGHIFTAAGAVAIGAVKDTAGATATSAIGAAIIIGTITTTNSRQ